MSALDRVMPAWHFSERHAVDVDAPAERAFAAACEVRLRDIPAAWALLTARGLAPGAGDRTFVGLMLGGGFVVAAEEPGRELVLAGVGRPWRLVERLRRGVDPVTFEEPGWARMAMTLGAEPGRLVTETRIALTDEAARRAFRRYWLVVRPFSGLTRRLLLRAAKRGRRAGLSVTAPGRGCVRRRSAARAALRRSPTRTRRSGRPRG